MTFDLWFNSLADILTPQYLMVIFLVSLIFSLPILWLNHRQIKASLLRDVHLYYLKRFIYWELALFIVITLLVLYNYPRL